MAKECLEQRPCNVLTPSFFERSAAKVARDLIGARLLRAARGRISAFVITETEAYVGTHDLACHAARGRTARTEVMFGPAGHFYIYRIYGLHWMLNIVTGKVNEGAAVLIRGVEGIAGPGRVTRSLAITGSLNGAAAVPEQGLWFEASFNARSKVLRTPRIGVEYAGPVWASKKLRFLRAG